MAYKLMIVDDEKANLRLLGRLFASDYECLTASSGPEAIQLLQQHDVAVLITDQRMPEMTGIELLKQTAELRPHMVRILLTGYTDVEALVEAINSGLVYMYVTKPWNNSELKVRIGRALEHYLNNKKRHSLELENERLISRLAAMKLGFVAALGEAMRSNDEYGYGHALRVSNHSSAIARTLGMSEEDLRELSSAALLHNLGHIGTPNQILFKTQQQLTDKEQASLEAHSERGAAILGEIAELRGTADTIRFHHENFDGTGYPRGLRGEQIPFACRIIRVADEYDLLTQPRHSSLAMSHKAAVDNLLARSEKHFDPRVVEALVEVGPEIGSTDTVQPVFHYA